ncbi:MAG: hypothetical protein HPY73_06425 [Methanomassiliicoccales archaeon]|nr:MAG: hypothetical protein HPY73_06425 [Methanomassiliicoccales archaeon]
MVTELGTLRRNPFAPKEETTKIWLNSSFRVMLINKGLEKAGSLNGLGRELGYRSRVHPGWSVLQILLGNQAFPAERLKRLAEYIGYPYEEILEHQTHPKRITPENTRDALMRYNLWCYVPK